MIEQPSKKFSAPHKKIIQGLQIPTLTYSMTLAGVVTLADVAEAAYNQEKEVQDQQRLLIKENNHLLKEGLVEYNIVNAKYHKYCDKFDEGQKEFDTKQQAEQKIVNNHKVALIKQHAPDNSEYNIYSYYI